MKLLEDAGISLRLALVIAGMVAAVIVALFFAVRQPKPALVYAPTATPLPDAAHPAARVFTVDAQDENAWHYFSFARAALVAPADGWDIAFRRYHVIVNGGSRFTGNAGVFDAGDVAFDSLNVAPRATYEGTTVRRDSVSALLERWYHYGFTTHLLTSLNHVYVVRTTASMFEKLQIMSYYCPGPNPGCM